MEDERMKMFVEKGQTSHITLFFLKISYMSNCGKVVGIYEWVCVVLCVIVWTVTLLASCQGEHILLSSTHCCQKLGQIMRCAIVIPQRTGPFSSPAKFVKGTFDDPKFKTQSTPAPSLIYSTGL